MVYELLDKAYKFPDSFYIKQILGYIEGFSCLLETFNLYGCHGRTTIKRENVNLWWELQHFPLFSFFFLICVQISDYIIKTKYRSYYRRILPLGAHCLLGAYFLPSCTRAVIRVHASSERSSENHGIKNSTLDGRPVAKT